MSQNYFNLMGRTRMLLAFNIVLFFSASIVMYLGILANQSGWMIILQPVLNSLPFMVIILQLLAIILMFTAMIDVIGTLVRWRNVLIFLLVALGLICIGFVGTSFTIIKLRKSIDDWTDVEYPANSVETMIENRFSQLFCNDQHERIVKWVQERCIQSTSSTIWCTDNNRDVYIKCRQEVFAFVEYYTMIYFIMETYVAVIAALACVSGVIRWKQDTLIARMNSTKRNNGQKNRSDPHDEGREDDPYTPTAYMAMFYLE